MNIVLQCEIQYAQVLKRYFNTYFQNITYIQYNNHLVNAIFIKQIRSIQDIKEMETLSFYHLDFIFLIENGEYMFELLKYNPLTFVRLSHIEKDIIHLGEIIYVFLTIFLYLLKCPQSLILSALRAFCFCGKPHISRSIFLYFRYQAWLKSW